MAQICFADQLKIPFSCWSIQLQEEFLKNGMKLDLIHEHRTRDSWGYLENNGSEYIIYTYRAIKDDEFQIIQDIVFKVELEMGEK